MGTADLFSQWRIADGAAMAATRVAAGKALLALDGRGELPSSAETERAKQLRIVADTEFLLAMTRMGQLARRAPGP